jgi:serine/threonine-protein kinase
MTSTPKPESRGGTGEEERLALALINRALVTRDEIRECRAKTGGPAGATALLQRLVTANFLTPNQARRATQELDLLVGQQIPGYQLLEKLGQGSMGAVFKGRQLSMNRLVAIKILNPKLAANPKELERFLHEAHLAAKLSHNNIVQGIDAGSAGKVHYFVMEYLEGTTIDKQIEGGRVFGEQEGVEIILQIAQALDHAHRRGMVHGDIKPGNIVMTKEGVAKLADLGLARQTDASRAEEEKDTIRGTPFYIAPELIKRREDIDIRADIYSLGGTLYHMVTGSPPFPGKKVNAIFEAHLHKELTPPDHLNTSLSSGLGEVVEFMMAKDRKKRYATPRELIRDLESLQAGEAPKFARQQIQAATLRGLAEGDAADVEIDRRRVRAESGVPLFPVIVLGVLLAISILLNVIMILRS